MKDLKDIEDEFEDDEDFEFEDDTESEEWVEVFKTNTMIEADMYKANLEGAEIPVQLLSQLDSAINFTFGGLGTVKIMVPESFVEEALEIINDIIENKADDPG
jgi:hypothetical protein